MSPWLHWVIGIQLDPGNEGVFIRLPGINGGRFGMLVVETQDDFYADLIEHPKTVRVVALSGGCSRDEACDKESASGRAAGSR